MDTWSMRTSLALLLLLVPVTAACGSASPGASGGNEVTATPGVSPTTAIPNCGLNASGEPARSNAGMKFPATTEYVGKTEAEAAALAKSRSLAVRVVGRDGECMAVTDDMRADRINVYIEGGRVTGVGAY